MSSINERIVLYCKSKRIKQVDLIKADYGAKMTINNIWHDKQKPSCAFLEKFVLENQDLNARWLLTGVGSLIDK